MTYSLENQLSVMLNFKIFAKGGTSLEKKLFVVINLKEARKNYFIN